MPTYVSLVQFTDKGIQSRQGNDPASGRLERQSAVQGGSYQPDVLDPWSVRPGLHLRRPNDETAASVLLAADMLGNIRTRTMRAFTTSEMEKILSQDALTCSTARQTPRRLGTQACCSKEECAALLNRGRGDAVSDHQPGNHSRNRSGLTNLRLSGSLGGADRAPSRQHRSQRNSRRDILLQITPNSIPLHSLNATSRPIR